MVIRQLSLGLALIMISAVSPIQIVTALQQQQQQQQQRQHHHERQQQAFPSSPTTEKTNNGISRRSLLTSTAALVATTPLTAAPALAAGSNGLPLTTAPSGLKWADAKVGTGQPFGTGTLVSIDYSVASTAGRFPQIYTTKDKGAPYRWKLGDGSTIVGIEEAIMGTEGSIPPMLPGGIRRVVIPASLGYQALSVPSAKCIEGESGAIGPIPPKDDMGAYQRWAQFYCNPRIPYQPDLVFDIKLYGQR